MTRGDFMFKWGVYALALLPALVLQFTVFARWPILGVTPLLLHVAALCVATLEGSASGAGFGLLCALLWSAATPGDTGGVFLLLPLLCALAGLAARKMLRQNFLGALLCCLVGLFCWELVRMGVRLFARSAAPAALLRIALPEWLVSLAFLLLLYPLFRAVFRRVGGTRLSD